MRGTALLALAVTTAGATGAAAQEWTVEARVGRLDFGLSPTPAPAATSVGIGLAYRELDQRLRFSAGVPTGEQDPLWLSLDGGARPTLAWGPLELGADLSATGFLQRYEISSESRGALPGQTLEGRESIWGNGIAGQALPMVSFQSGPVGLRVRGGLSYYRSSLDDAEISRTVPLADARLLLRPAASLALTGELRRFGGDAGGVTFASGGALLALPGVTFWGSLGRWYAESDPEVAWSAGGTLALAERLDLTVQARQQSLDPLYGSSPRRAWDVGLELALSRPPEPAAPVPSEYHDGRAVVALSARHAPDRPSIAGSFNDWTPTPMTRDGDRWVHTLALEAGVYEYAFVDARGEWFVPEGTPGRKDDGMGGHVALLIVEEGES